MINHIFILLCIFQLKHFLADYPLQNRYMLGKFKSGNEWVLPLAYHCGVHAAFTALITSFLVGFNCIYLALFDFTIHFVMDRIKASPYILGRFKPDQYQFWWSLGFDQMIHHLTHYIIIFACLH